MERTAERRRFFERHASMSASQLRSKLSYITAMVGGLDRAEIKPQCLAEFDRLTRHAEYLKEMLA